MKSGGHKQGVVVGRGGGWVSGGRLGARWAGVEGVGVGGVHVGVGVGGGGYS